MRRPSSKSYNILLSTSSLHESSRIFRTDVRYTSSRLPSGIAKGSQPFAWGVGLCPTSLPLARRLRRRTKKKRKRVFRGYPEPRQRAQPSALPLFRIFVSKIRDDSCLPIWVKPKASQELSLGQRSSDTMTSQPFSPYRTESQTSLQERTCIRAMLAVLLQFLLSAMSLVHTLFMY